MFFILVICFLFIIITSDINGSQYWGNLLVWPFTIEPSIYHHFPLHFVFIQYDKTNSAFRILHIIITIIISIVFDVININTSCHQLLHTFNVMTTIIKTTNSSFSSCTPSMWQSQQSTPPHIIILPKTLFLRWFVQNIWSQIYSENDRFSHLLWIHRHQT